VFDGGYGLFDVLGLGGSGGLFALCVDRDGGGGEYELDGRVVDDRSCDGCGA
jgi:hypothetical protein